MDRDAMQEHLDTMPQCRTCGQRPEDCTCGDEEYERLMNEMDADLN